MFNLTVLHVRVFVQFIKQNPNIGPCISKHYCISTCTLDVNAQMLNLSNKKRRYNKEKHMQK